MCVLYFCAEGENVPDAFLITDAVQRYLHYRKPGASGMVFPSHFPQQSDGMLIGESLLSHLHSCSNNVGPYSNYEHLLHAISIERKPYPCSWSHCSIVIIRLQDYLFIL